jgi:hypothetical protein
VEEHDPIVGQGRLELDLPLGEDIAAERAGREPGLGPANIFTGGVRDRSPC